MVDFNALINGVEYGWSSITVNIGGVPILGIRGIKYEEEQEKENIYAAGAHPYKRGYGRVKTTASITLLGSTVMALKSNAPMGKLHLISPFTIVVSYLPKNGLIQTHHIKMCEFKKTAFDWKEGDMFKEIEFELITGEIVDKTNN